MHFRPVPNLGRPEPGAHDRPVQGEINPQIAVLTGIDPASPHGGIQAFLRQRFCQDHGSSGVRCSEIAFVIIVVVGGRQMPARIQSPDVGIVGGLVFLPRAAAHLDQANHRIQLRHIAGKGLEIPIEGTGVVELADGGRHFPECLKISLHAVFVIPIIFQIPA